MERRSFIIGLGALLLPSPAIVHATSLMPIRAPLPEWITAHANNPLFGELIVRKPGIKHLDEFRGRIKPGEFFWRTADGRLIDVHHYPVTDVLIRANMCSITDGSGHWGDERPGARAQIKRAGIHVKLR